MLYNKNDEISKYTVVFPHKESLYAETYRVKDECGKTRFLKLINYAKLNRYQIDDSGNLVEVEISKKLNHHNLCSFVDSGSIMVNGGQRTYIVTEFVSGETLSQRLVRDNQFSVYDIKTIAVAVLSALDYLHNLIIPIIHGEVTIQNIMLNMVGGLADLKLIDFGHACFLNQPPVKPDLNELSPFYLAPERFSGVSQIQSDIFSVGVIMYQLLYGELPWFVDLSRFKGDKVERILEERNKPLRLPQKDIFELDEQFVNCIIRALSYDVEDWFQSANEFIQAIKGEIKVERQDTCRKIKANEDNKADKTGNTSLSHKAAGPGFSAIAGMDELKLQLQEEIIEPLHHPEEYERYGVTIPNGMLLYGPPGCGKTFFAKHFAEEVGFNFMFITPATLKSRYVNASQENIAKMFREAEENAPTIIFIDEINELVPNREENVHEMSRSAVNEMLAQMDRTGEKGVFIIGATNSPHMIDPAILRAGRLEKKYYIGVPDDAARKALFELYLKNRPYDFGLDYDELSALTKNYVSADIQLIVNNAARIALKKRSKITMGILKDTINTVRPSLAIKELQRYEAIKAQMNGEEVNKSGKRPKIGFR
jgi:ATPases of the AAA+ class